MTFTDSIKTCFSKYADFSGRASRPEYWWFVLFIIVAGTAISFISEMVGLVFYLATLVPSLAAAARRLHDTDRSGWMQLIALIPLIGAIILIVFLAQPSKASDRITNPEDAAEEKSPGQV